MLAMMDAEAVHILLKLIPYSVVTDLEEDVKFLAKIAGVSTRTFKKHWPALKRFFNLQPNGNLRLCEDGGWFTVRARRSRISDSVYDALTDFWGALCAYCGSQGDNLEVDHIVPVSRGGSNDIRNLTLACRPCNMRKRDQTAEEFGHPQLLERARRIK